eukprot:gene12605-2361_t
MLNTFHKPPTMPAGGGLTIMGRCTKTLVPGRDGKRPQDAVSEPAVCAAGRDPVAAPHAPCGSAGSSMGIGT